MIHRSVLLGLITTTALQIFCFSAHAAEKPNDAADTQALLKALNEQAARLNAQEKALQEQQRSLAQEKERFRDLQKKVSSLTGEPVEMAEPNAKTLKLDTTQSPPSATSVSVQPAATPSSPAPAKPTEVGIERRQQPEKPPEVAAITDVGGVLLRKNQIVLTPSLEYSRSSATRVSVEGAGVFPAINYGLFEIAQVQRDTLTAAMGVRYGITNRFEVEAKVPYIYRNDQTRTRPIGIPTGSDVLSDVNGYDIGDVEFGAHYQINRGTGGWPFLVGNLRVKTDTGTSPFDVPVINGVPSELPTGNGFYGIQPSITAIYPSDPVVYFANLGYLYNVGKSISGVGDVEPGDSISSAFGMSLSLNDKASFSVGYSHNTVFETTVDGQTPRNSSVLQVGSLDLGYAYSLNKRTSLNLTVSAGLTEDAPDARIQMRVPLTYDMK